MNTRRTFLRNMAAAGGAGLLWQRALAAGNNPVPPGFQRLAGQVTLNGQPAREGQLVRPGDRIATGPGAEAIYVVGQDAFLQRENTRVNFGDTASAAFLRVVTGKLMSVFGRGDKRIQLSTATIGIRGTGCYIEEPAEGSRDPSYFCLCYGVADVVPEAAPAKAERIVTSHHDHPVYIHADPAMPTMMVTAPVRNHYDAELVMLENLVGRWPPFHGKTGAKY